MLAIQKLLKEDFEGGMKYIQEVLHIKVKEKDNRLLFKYNQINSPLRERIAQEARGLILDKRTLKVISWPFLKFFNLSEPNRVAIDFASAKVFEKVDGTCCTIYFYEDEWHVQILGQICADEVCIQGYAITFADLFWKHFPIDPKQLNSEYSYTFELATKINRVVTRYQEDRLVLLSIRHISTLQEIPFGSPFFNQVHQMIGCEIPQTFSFDSLDDIAAMAKQLPPLEEGYVCCDKDFNRVKIKNPQYVALSHLKSSSTSSIRNLCQLVLRKEEEEFLSYFPEYQTICLDIRNKIENEARGLESLYQEIKEIESQKDFAQKALVHKWSGILFSLRKGTIKTAWEGFEASSIDKIISYFNLRELEGE